MLLTIAVGIPVPVLARRKRLCGVGVDDLHEVGLAPADRRHVAGVDRVLVTARFVERHAASRTAVNPESSVRSAFLAPWNN